MDNLEEMLKQLHLKDYKEPGPITSEFVKVLNNVPNAGPAKIKQYKTEPQLDTIITTSYIAPETVLSLLKNPLVIKEFAKFDDDPKNFPLKATFVKSRSIDGIIASTIYFTFKKWDSKKSKKHAQDICKELFEERYDDILCYQVANLIWTQMIIIFDLKKSIITILAYKNPN
jgi:hypothetical protein